MHDSINIRIANYGATAIVSCTNNKGSRKALQEANVVIDSRLFWDPAETAVGRSAQQSRTIQVADLVSREEKMSRYSFM